MTPRIRKGGHLNAWRRIGHPEQTAWELRREGQYIYVRHLDGRAKPDARVKLAHWLKGWERTAVDPLLLGWTVADRPGGGVNGLVPPPPPAAGAASAVIMVNMPASSIGPVVVINSQHAINDPMAALLGVEWQAHARRTLRDRY